MDLVSLSVAAGALALATVALREAIRSSSRKLARKVHEELEDLETFKRNLRRDWEEERDRLGKQARRTGATLKRLDAVLDESSESADGDENADAGGGDAGGGAESQLRPVRPNVVTLPWRGGRTG